MVPKKSVSRFLFSTNNPKNYFYKAERSTYKRELEERIVTRFNSEIGKKYFREALDQGTMQTYFPLAEHFVTQGLPSTCGSTTLVMILNSLGIDPGKNWKGIWRWYDEFNIKCPPDKYLYSIDLENYSHVALKNGLSIQTFYVYEKEEDACKKARAQDSSNFCKECQTKTLFVSKVASAETFEDCVEAVSRRNHWYITINHSRPALHQTGQGHFSPIGGYNPIRRLVYLMDVARYKYPSYWCNVDMVYEALRQTDDDTKRTRGFNLISRSHLQYPEICRGFEDYELQKMVVKELSEVKPCDQVGRDGNFVGYILKNSFTKNFRLLLVYYLYEFSIRIETIEEASQIPSTYFLNTFGNRFGESYMNNLAASLRAHPIYSSIDSTLERNKNSKPSDRFLNLVVDFQPNYYKEMVSLIIMSLPQQYLTILWREFNNPATEGPFPKELFQPASGDMEKESSFFKKIFGF